MTVTQERRGRGRPKGTPASEAQKATNPGARKQSSAARKKRAAARALEKPKWKKLEDGDITLKDLSMDELIEGTCWNNDGTREGRRHKFNPRWLARMDTERRKRIREGISRIAPDALEAMEDIVNDDEHNQRFQASKLVLEYEIGKVPDVVHVGHETEWDRIQQTGFRIVRGAEAVEVDDDEVVDGELVEED